MDKLKDYHKKALLCRARKSIASVFDPSLPIEPLEKNTLYEEKCGLFVTLTIHGRLRGCIGYVTGVQPLKEAVIYLSREAAFQDPRFPPLMREELPDLQIEISLLSPLKEVRDFEEIQIGLHGLFICRNHLSGLLLPQVATEYHWDRDEFLENTCLKAGLSPDMLGDSATEVYLFTAEIFSEKEAHGR